MQAETDSRPTRDETESTWWKILRHFTLFTCMGWLIFPIYAFWLWEWVKTQEKQPRSKGLRRYLCSFLFIVGALAIHGEKVAAEQSRFEPSLASLGLELVMPKIPAITDHVRWLEGLVLHAPARGLFALCDGMFLDWGYGPEKEAKEIGLTDRDIENAAEARLRSARLYKDRSPQAMDVSITLTASAFHLKIALKRAIGDLGYGIDGVATIWSTGFVGRYSSKQPILSALSQGLDDFLATYLRVNAPACDRTYDQLYPAAASD